MFSYCPAIIAQAPLCTDTAVMATPVTGCGQQLSSSSIDLGVPALSNFNCMGKGNCDCDPVADNGYEHCTKGNKDGTIINNRACYHGLHWQCVEFVKRFYSLRTDTNNEVDTSTWSVGYARAFFLLLPNGDYSLDNYGNLQPSASVAGFTAFRNGSVAATGSPNLPQPDDIVVFDDGDEYGHAAVVVKSYGKSYLDIVEQNFSHTGLCSLTITAGKVDARGSYSVVGWLRSNKEIGAAQPSNPIPVIGHLSTAPSPTVVGNFNIEITNATDVDLSSIRLYLTGTDCSATGAPNGGPNCLVGNGDFLTKTSNALTASVDLVNQGYYNVYLQNGATGALSLPWQLEVQAPVPSISGLVPSSLPLYSTGQTITINGSGFTPTAALTFNKQPHFDTYISPSQITMITTLADVSSAGSYPVVVTNPAPGGGSSTASNLAVTTAAPVMSVTPPSLSFGNQKVGTAAAKQPVTVQNAGSGSMAAVSISIAGPNASDFAASSGCTSALSAGKSCQVQVGFTPSSTGSRAATLTISSGGVSGSQQTVALSGQGVAGGVQITATVSPTNPTAGITNVTITGTASPNATVMVSETHPGSSTPSSFSEIANSSGTFVDGPFIPQLAGQYSETFSDSSGDTPTTATFTAVKLPTPTIEMINPPVPTHMPTDQPVVVTGTGLASGLSILVTFPTGSSTLSGSQAKWVSDSEVDCKVLFNGTGQWTFQIKNPDGQVSNVLNFYVQ
jgi:hypothetical protein